MALPSISLPALIAPTLYRIDPDDPIIELMPKFPFPTTATPRQFVDTDGRLKRGADVKDEAGKVHWSFTYDVLSQGDPA